MGKRRYQLKKRAQEQQETRRRIVEATVALHREVGPAATTISAIAEKAGVQRLTVYRHFPDEGELFRACSDRVNERNPPPDPAPWSRIADPEARLEAVLADVYAYYGRGEAMLARVLRDAETMPALAAVLAPMQAYLEAAARLVAAAWGPPPEGERPLRAAALHALAFSTWRSLRAQGLADEEAVDLMRRFVAAVAGHAQGKGADEDDAGGERDEAG